MSFFEKHFAKYQCRLRLFAIACWQAGWRAAALIALGAGTALGFRPLGAWPLALLGVAALIALVARAPTWPRGALIGWLWGVGHFTLGNNWIATAFTYQAKMPPWLGWVAVVGLSLYLALFPALVCAAGWFARRDPVARVLGFAGAWIVGEVLRGWAFTGFPWNPLGAALLDDFAHPGLAGFAPWLGTYGLSGLAALLAGVLGEGLRLLIAGDHRRGASLAAAPVALGAGALLLPSPAALPGHIPYTLIQPNVAQEDLDDPAHYDHQYLDSAKLSAPQTSATYRPGQPRLVLWPESGVPDYVRDGYPAWYYQYTFAGDPWMARWRLARAIGRGGLLLTGTVDLDFKGVNAISGQNVVAGIDDQGRIAAHYAKAHLVPLGEYLPFRAVLKPLGLERVIPGDIDFRPGPGPQTLDLGPLGKAGIQICYEIIFPGAVTDRATRADYIFNPSNDGWYGSWGPPQHLAQARLRAIEEGLPVLRSTTNGISAVIDARGVVRQSALRGVAARLDGVVPAALPPTLFARYGNMVPLALATLLLAACALVLRLRRR